VTRAGYSGAASQSILHFVFENSSDVQGGESRGGRARDEGRGARRRELSCRSGPVLSAIVRSKSEARRIPFGLCPL
jgi:hypothetical protein